MPSLIYAPGVRAYIATAQHGTVDVSEDLVNGTMVRRSDGVSTFDFSIMNARRKYDQVFAPNDRIIVMMKRITWLRVFTGYLNSVPLRTAWPRDVSLSASCSLKRLQYYYWDPYAAESQRLMIQQISSAGESKYQGGASARQIQALLNTVVGWPLANIHIGSIPSNWYKIATEVSDRLKTWSDEAVEGYEAYLESLGVDSEAVIKGTLVDRLRSALDLDAGGGGGGGASSGFGVVDPGLSGDALGVPSGGGSSGGTPSSGGGRGGSSGGGPVSGQGVGDALKGNATPNTPIVGGTAPLSLISAGSYGGYRLSSAQTRVAVQMYNAAAAYGGWRSRDGKNRANIPIYMMICMYMAAMQESSLNNNATNGLGYYGLFQMDKNKLDGSVKARTNIRRSVHWFLDTALYELARNPKKYPRVTAEVMARLAEAVEISGHEERYRKYYELAYQLTMSINRKQASRIGPSRNPNDPNNVKAPIGGPGYRGARQSGAVSGAQLVRTAVGLINNNPGLRYVYGGGHGGSDPRNGVDCSAFISWTVRTASGGRTRFDGTSSTMSAGTKRISVQQALRTPGALLFAPGHVEFSMGNGTQTVGAGSPRSGVKVRPASHNRWTHGGLIPGIGYNGQSAGVGDSGGAPRRQSRVFPVPSHKASGAYFGQTGSWSRYHTGTDFPAPTGAKVVAAQSGQVIHAGSGGSEGGWAGNYVVIQHSGNFRTVYAHLSSISVGNGARVQGGQKIGEVGATGRAFGSHLHFEVRKPPYKIYEGTINPMPWLRGSYQDSGSSGGDTSGYIPTGSSGGGGQGVGLTGSLEPKGYVDHTYSESPLYDASSPIDSMFAETAWAPGPTSTEALVQSASDIGVLTIAHDSTVLQYMMSICASSMRSFCSAPNGDFICWFPDYYGLWGTAAVLRIEPIEVQDFNVNWSDDNFVTHQFIQTQAATLVDPGTGLLQNITNPFFTSTPTGDYSSPVGFANIDAPEVMASLFGIAPENHKTFARFIYQRFGARPNIHQVEATLTKEGNYFMALYYFMLQWAYQYQAAVPTTWMPEAYPGMLMQIPYFNFQAYITSVTHQFQFGPGGSFSTMINIASPSYMPSSNKDHSLVGLPIAGGYRKGKLLAQDYRGPRDSFGKVPELPGEGLVGGARF